MKGDYFNLQGKNLLMRLTENGTKPIDKEIIATLSNEDIDALIVAFGAAKEELAINTLEDQQENVRWITDTGRAVPPCFYYWDIMGSELCAYGGTYSAIEREQCDGCPNYGVMVGLEKEIPEL